MTAELVSVITPTWQRHDLLLRRSMPCVAAQTYPNVEHIVVSDGPDPALAEIMADHPEITFAQCGRNWSTTLRDSFAAAPVIVGTYLARGEYLMYLADDDAIIPTHIEDMVSFLKHEDADFVWGMVAMVLPDGVCYAIPRPGVTRPMYGQITAVVHKRELLDISALHTHDGMMSDWLLFERWLNAGAKAAFLPRLTMTHYVNH